MRRLAHGRYSQLYSQGAAAMRPPAISSNNLLSFVIFILIIYCIESAVTENLSSLSFVL